MGSREIVVAAVAGVIIATAGGVSAAIVRGRTAAATPQPVREAAGETPVVVELFTSEGCSSCPAADTVLARLAATQPIKGAHIIALSEHVDYWNQLGWRDPFSSAAYSRRQSEYASAFRSDQVYTPQMVVDGQTEFVGSDERAAGAAIAEAARKSKAQVTVALSSGNSATVRVSGLHGGVGPVDVYAAVTESGLVSQVANGENAGRRLTHAAVVRRLERIGTIGASGAFDGIFHFEAPPSGQDVRIVSFVQERNSRHIAGAGEATVAG